MPDLTQWLIYLGVFFGPFVQEDAAALAAATLSVNQIASTPLLFIAITLGLFVSDIWKYWIGWGALRNARARRFVEKENVAALNDKVTNNLIATLFSARFIPLTRVPTYVACGLFQVNYLKFCLIILLTAFCYAAFIFTLFHLLGEVVGDSLKWALPIIGLTIAGITLAWLFWKKHKAAHRMGSDLDDAD